MKIFIIGKFGTEMQAEHMAGVFEQMGHAVTRYRRGVKYAPKASNLWKRWIQVKNVLFDLAGRFGTVREWRAGNLVDEVRQTSPDLVLVPHDYLTPAQIQMVRDVVDTRIVMWFPDGMANFGSAMFLGADYDALFFKDPYVVQYLKGKLDTSVYYLPQCYHREKHRLGGETLTKAERDKFECEITTAGNLYAYRQAFFRQLDDYDVKIWGAAPPMWMKHPVIMEMYEGEFVYNETKAAAFLGAKVVLNNMHPHEVYGLNKRAFEACGIGAFQILDWTPGLSQLFEPGEEVVVFRNMEGLKGKLNYYLEHEDKRRRIAEAGKQRAIKEHTYEDRLELILKTVFGDAEGFPMPEVEISPQAK